MKAPYLKDPNHRYSLVVSGGKNDANKIIIRMDTATGETWKLVANIWVPITEPKKGKE